MLEKIKLCGRSASELAPVQAGDREVCIVAWRYES
jgi:hypothetical protein